MDDDKAVGMITDAKSLSKEELATLRASAFGFGPTTVAQRLLATIEAARAHHAQQAARIGELEGLTRRLRSYACDRLAANGDGEAFTLIKEIDAALSASPTPPAQPPQASADRLVEALTAFHGAWVEHEVSYAVGDPELVKAKRSAVIDAHKVAHAALAAHKENPDA